MNFIVDVNDIFKGFLEPQESLTLDLPSSPTLLNYAGHPDSNLFQNVIGLI